MKKILLTILALCAFLCPANAVNEDGNVNVYFSSFKEVTPDVAQVTFGVKTYDKNLQKASVENKKLSDLLYSSLKSLINEQRGDYIKTSNYYAQPLYTYKGNRQDIDKYEVSNSVTVFVKDINLISKLIDSAMTKGVTNIDNLDFKVSEYESHCNNLLQELTKKSYNRANHVVKPLNMKVSGVKSINATCNSDSSSSANYRANKTLSASMDSTENSSTPVEAGKTKINANINASFYVK